MFTCVRKNVKHFLHEKYREILEKSGKVASVQVSRSIKHTTSYRAYILGVDGASLGGVAGGPAVGRGQPGLRHGVLLRLPAAAVARRRTPAVRRRLAAAAAEHRLQQTANNNNWSILQGKKRVIVGTWDANITANTAETGDLLHV